MRKRTLSILLALIMLISVAPLTFAGLADDGLIAHWTFDEVVDGAFPDVTGNGHNAVHGSNNPVTNNRVVAGKIGNAISFTQSGNSNQTQWLTVPHHNDLNFTANDSYTMSLWVRTSYTDAIAAIFYKSDATSNGTLTPYYGVWTRNRGLVSGIGERGQYDNESDSTQGITFNPNNNPAPNPAYIFTPVTYPLNEWVLFTVVQDGEAGIRRVYQNGVLADVGSAGNGNNNANLTIGGGTGNIGNQTNFRGMLDDFRIYDRALSAAEIMSLYAIDAEVYTLAGKVLPGATGASAGGVTVHLYKAATPNVIYDSAVTAADGSYSFQVLAGDYNLKVHRTGNTRTGQISASVTTANVTADITLVSGTRNVIFNVTPAAANAEVYVRDAEGKLNTVSKGVYNLDAGEYTYYVQGYGYDIARGNFTVSDQNLTIPVALAETSSKEIILSADVVRDRMEGGWAAQMAGVAWAAPYEFWSEAAIMSESYINTMNTRWNSTANNRTTINDAFNQDDLYVEIPFLQAMYNHGPNVPVQVVGEYFRDTTFRLWHANRAGRWNLKAGIPAPDSGHYLNNAHANDIDWQIEADSTGMAALGQPNLAAEMSWRIGHVMNYGDGVYGGVFVSAAYAAAFTAKDLDEVIDKGLTSIPADTQYRELMEDVIHEYRTGSSFEETWGMVNARWENRDYCCFEGFNRNFDINAHINSAYILIGLLYGRDENGTPDMDRILYYSVKCGQDSDCNPSSAAGIYGALVGYNALPEKWIGGGPNGTYVLNRALNFEGYNDFTFDYSIDYTLGIAKAALEMNGGSVDPVTGDWTIPAQGPTKTLIREQWPRNPNDRPVITTATAVLDPSDPTGRTYIFDVAATDADGIADYQWFFGDLAFDAGASLTHTYPGSGNYNAILYTADTVGNTSWREIVVEVVDKAGLLAAIAEYDASKNKYTIDSLAGIGADYEAAIDVLGDLDATQDQVNAATKALLDAIDGLVEAVLDFGAGQPAALTLKRGQVYQITISSNNQSEVLFFSANGNVSLSPTGLVTGVKPGIAIITVVDTWSGQFFNIVINVTN